MLYKKNVTRRLDMDLFKNPTSEYRGAPFWAWNCKLDREELLWQMEVLKKMGFGGAHAHVRSGMATTYLSDEYMELIGACVEKAKEEGMLLWLYDEDRWPSGAAGGYVTREEKYRKRYLVFSLTPLESAEDWGESAGQDTGNGFPAKRKLLSCYDIFLDEDARLREYRMIPEEEEARHEKWYAYLEISASNPWYNNQTYVNTLDKAAMDRFIQVTYERYLETVGKEFGETIPAIFTDEPQFQQKGVLKFAAEKERVILPWTDDLADTYRAAYPGEDLLAKLPEILWEREDSQPSVVRYHYHDHVCERFVCAFCDNCGKWCAEHGLALTGHMIQEPSLWSQTGMAGEVMRSYRGFEIPGIDMLCAYFEYTTAKQAQSAVHQYGREAMMSELYGVTSWDFDFRGYKLHGDWQAALGVTVRVPHLSWVSMAGEAKRDYPASIHYQSPWWEKYGQVEDHFARLNTALTRGKPVVKVGVIHPVESYWLHYGPQEQTALEREERDRAFQDLTKWLLFGGIDFDFISESLLPGLCEEGGAPLRVGEMSYGTVLVAGCETLRSTTLERLEKFAEGGGKLILAGEAPKYVDAVRDERGKALARKAHCVQHSREGILNALQEDRLIEIRDQTGALTDNLLYQLRQDKEGQWLFVAHGKEPYNKDISRYQDVRIRVRGEWKATVYDTFSGETGEIRQETRAGETRLCRRMYDYDSLLVWLEPALENACEEGAKAWEETEEQKITKGQEEKKVPVEIPSLVSYTLSEPNALLLDRAEYALDGGPWQKEEEILRLDGVCRGMLGWAGRNGKSVQPWVIGAEKESHVLRLKWRVESEIEYEGAKLAMEDAEKAKLYWNGKEIGHTPDGYYVDKAIRTVKLPKIEKGTNVLEAEIPYGKRTNVEWVYVLGEFGVSVFGKNTRIEKLQSKIAFGSLTQQGLAFYGGNITYHVPVRTGKGELAVRSGCYAGATQEASVDGKAAKPMTYPPYETCLGEVEAGEHRVDITLCGNRRNSFGPVHLKDRKEKWIGPQVWRSVGDRWCYEYMLCEVGILTTPEILLKEDTLLG